MNPLKGRTHRPVSRSAIIAFRAMRCLALLSTLARRLGLAVLAATALSGALPTAAPAETTGTVIRPFRVNVPDSDLADLRRRLAGTRWPDKETVADQSQGVPGFNDTIADQSTSWTEATTLRRRHEHHRRHRDRN